MPQWNSGSSPQQWSNRFGASADHWRSDASAQQWVSGSSSDLWTPGSGAVPTFYQPFNSGVSSPVLPSGLTINAATVQPKFQLFASDATTSGWTARTGGVTMSVAGSGSLPTAGAGTPLLGADALGLRFNDGQYYESSDTVFDATDGDLAFEMVFQMDFTKVNIGYGSKRGGAPVNGWDFISVDSLSAMRFQLFLAGASFNIQVGGWAANTWYHLMAFVDRNDATSNGARLYRNGQSIGNTNPIAANGDTSSTSDFYMGTHSFSPSTLEGSRGVAYLSMWESSGWFAGGGTNTTHWNAIALERFRRMCGSYPLLAKGTAAPTIHGRTSSAYLDHAANTTEGRSLYLVGADWQRAETFSDGTVTKQGRRGEQAATNLCPDSTSTINSANTVITADDTNGPNLMPEADLVTESTDGGATTHTCEHDTATANISGLDATQYCISVFVKASARTQVQLSPSSTANIDFDLDVDLSAVTAGVTIGDNGGITTYGNGWYRIWVCATQSGAGSWNPQLILKDSGSNSYTGTGAAAIYVWGWQVEVNGIASSFIRTVGATATRTIDTLRYKADDGNLGGVGSELKGTIRCDAFWPDGDYPATGTTGDGVAWSLSDGGSNNDRILLFHNSQWGTGAGSGFGDTFTSIADGAWHSLTSTWSNDLSSMETSDDGTELIDSAFPGAVPNDLDHFQVGGTLNGSQAGDGVVGAIRIDAIARVKD